VGVLTPPNIFTIKSCNGNENMLVEVTLFSRLMKKVEVKDTFASVERNQESTGKKGDLCNSVKVGKPCAEWPCPGASSEKSVKKGSTWFKSVFKR